MSYYADTDQTQAARPEAEAETRQGGKVYTHIFIFANIYLC